MYSASATGIGAMVALFSGWIVTMPFSIAALPSGRLAGSACRRTGTPFFSTATFVSVCSSRTFSHETVMSPRISS
jgi:hypothetical protein